MGSVRDIVQGVSTMDRKAISVTPQTRGSFDYLSTRGIQVDVRLPDATSENRVESPLYEELYPNTTPTQNLSQQSNIITA